LKLVLKYTVFPTPLGPMYAAASEAGVCRVTSGVTDEAFATDMLNRFDAELAFAPDNGLLTSVEDQITRYFEGKLKDFDLPVDFLRGTSFTRQVWTAQQAIPYGQWRSYKWVAEQVRRPRAARAVGQANSSNDIGLLVPCHRVITSDGRLGGYGGRPEVKAFLLDLEGTDYNR